METTVAPPIPFVERRRPYPAAPRGRDFVERRQPTPLLLRDVDDLHDADLEAVLADQLAFSVSAAQAVDAAAALAELIGATGSAAFAAHVVSSTLASGWRRVGPMLAVPVGDASVTDR
jgi:hypothetical protein